MIEIWVQDTLDPWPNTVASKRMHRMTSNMWGYAIMVAKFLISQEMCIVLHLQHGSNVETPSGEIGALARSGLLALC